MEEKEVIYGILTKSQFLRMRKFLEKNGFAVHLRNRITRELEEITKDYPLEKIFLLDEAYYNFNIHYDGRPVSEEVIKKLRSGKEPIKLHTDYVRN